MNLARSLTSTLWIVLADPVLLADPRQRAKLSDGERP